MKTTQSRYPRVGLHAGTPTEPVVSGLGFWDHVLQNLVTHILLWLLLAAMVFVIFFASQASQPLEPKEGAPDPSFPSESEDF